MHNAYDFQDGLSDFSIEAKKPAKPAAPVYRNNYKEVQSELEQNISQQREEINITLNAKPQKLQPQKLELKLVLPEEPPKKVEEERNNPNKKEKKIKIQTIPAQEVKLNIRNSIVHISNLEDEDQGVIVLESNYNYRQPTQSYKINHQINQKIERELREKKEDTASNDNSFLEVKEEKIQEVPLFKRTLIIQEEVVSDPHVKILSKPQQPAPLLKNESKSEFPIKLKIDKPFVKKSMLFENNNDSGDYYFPDSASKTSLDTGIQVLSQMSSRDQLSTRNILSQSSLFKEKSGSRKKLPTIPTLKPYKEVLRETEKKAEFSILEGANRQQDRQKLFANFRFGKFSIASEQIVNVFDFIKKPIPAGRVLECKLFRNKSCGKMFFLDYDLATASDEKFLLSTKKMPLRLNSTYNMSLRSGYYEDNSEYYLGKAKGNFSGSIFNIQGELPNSRQKETTATIYYSSQCFGLEIKARQIEIYIKSEDYRYHQLDGAEHDKTKNLKDLYEIGSNKQMKKIKKLINKKPRWNPITEVYSMNFHGKSRMGSVKNMIIIDEERPNDYLLLLAKQGSNEFAMDIAYPFSPLVALGLMISGFDFKLASQ